MLRGLEQVRVVLLAPRVTSGAEKMSRRNGMEFRKISMLELTRILTREGMRWKAE